MAHGTESQPEESRGIWGGEACAGPGAQEEDRASAAAANAVAAAHRAPHAVRRPRLLLSVVTSISPETGGHSTVGVHSEYSVPKMPLA